MSKDRNGQPQTLTRAALHELVWSEPMVRLGARFGISGNGLAKICRRLDVPYPPRGWWAKKAAGHKVKAAPLGPAKPGTAGQVTITPTSQETGGLTDIIREQAARVGEIAVPERLTRPHPIIAAWVSDHQQRQDRARRDRDPWSRSLYNVPGFTAGERRGTALSMRSSGRSRSTGPASARMTGASLS